MASDGKIRREDFFDKSAFEAFNELSERASALIKTMSSLSKEIKKGEQELNKAKGFKEYANTAKKTAKSVEKLSIEEKEHQKIIQQLEREKAKLNLQQSKEFKELEKLKQQRRDNNKLMGAEKGSIAALRAENRKLADARDKVTTTTEKGRKKIEALNAQINKNNQIITKNSDKLTKQKINIGNYESALSGLGGKYGMVISQTIQFGKGLAALAINPVFLAITALVGAVVSLGKAFASTDKGATELASRWEQLKTIGNVYLQQINNMIEGHEVTIRQFIEAAKAAREYTYALDELNDAKIASISQDKQDKAQIERLIALSKDQTREDEERVELMLKALKIQDEYYKRQIGFAEESYEQQLELASKKYDVDIKSLNRLVQADYETTQKLLSFDEDLARARDRMNDDEYRQLEELYVEKFLLIEKEAKRRKELTSLVTGLQKKIMNRVDETSDKVTETFEDAKISAEDFKNYFFRVLDEIDERIKKENERLGRLENPFSNVDFEMPEEEFFEDEELQKIKDYFKEIEESGKQTWASLTDSASTFFETRQNLINNDIQSLQNKMQREIELAGDSAEARETIEEKYSDKLAELRRKQATNEKLQGIFSAAISTASAVAKALPNIPLSLLVGGIGAAQITAIATRPIPEFFKGTDSSPEGLAWTGEKGSELMIDKKGNFGLSPDKPSLSYLESGTKVIPADITREIMRNTVIANVMSSKGKDSEAVQIIERLDKSNSELKKELRRKKFAQVNIDSKGISVMTRSERSLQHRIDKYFRS